MQDSDWNCGNILTPNHKKKPFDDVRVRRALALAIDQWNGAPALAKIANVRTVGGIVFPGSPLAATKEELQKIAGFWPDIEKSRAEAKRLLKEAGAEGLKFELLNRNVDQPYKFVGTWVIGEWKKIGLNVEQKVVPTGPWFSEHARRHVRRGDGGQLPERGQPGARYRQVPAAQGLSRRTTATTTTTSRSSSTRRCRHETDPGQAARRRCAPTRPTRSTRRRTRSCCRTGTASSSARSYVKGWKISPSHYLNQDLANIWLDK